MSLFCSWHSSFFPLNWSKSQTPYSGQQSPILYDSLLPFWPHILALALCLCSNYTSHLAILWTCRACLHLRAFHLPFLLPGTLPAPTPFHLVHFIIFFMYNKWYLSSNSHYKSGLWYVLENSENLVLDVWPSLEFNITDSWVRMFGMKN